jgi:hypothetical protein
MLLRINTWKLNVFVSKDESYINIKTVFELLREHKIPRTTRHSFIYINGSRFIKVFLFMGFRL